MTLVSMPVPLMFLPIWSTISRSSFLTGSVGSHCLRKSQQFDLAFVELFRRDGGDAAGFVIGVLDDRQTAEDVAFSEHFAGDGTDDLAEARLHDGPVIDFRPVVLAQADQHHLVQARLDVADEPRVRLDAVDDQHMIGLGGVFVEMDRQTVGRLGHDDGFHRRANGGTDERLR